MDKFQRAQSATLPCGASLRPACVQTLLGHIVEQKFEQRAPSGDIFDTLIIFLSGEQESLMEISYTKQQQKQKQKQQNKNQDSDTMETFDKKHQLEERGETDNYFQYTLTPRGRSPEDLAQPAALGPDLQARVQSQRQAAPINIYPTLQFLYSHHIQPEYIERDQGADTGLCRSRQLHRELSRLCAHRGQKVSFAPAHVFLSAT